MLASIAGAALTLLSSWSLGRWLLRRFNLPWTLHFAVGSAMLSVAIFGLLAVHIARPWAMAGLSVLSLAPLFIHRPRLASWTAPPRWAWPMMLIYSALYLYHGLQPELQPDALSYHLTLGVTAQASGGFPPNVTFFNVVPQGMEALFAMAYSIGGEVAAKLVHLAFLLATVPLVVTIAAALQLPLWSGWAAALFYAITPVVGMSGACAYTDAAITFYTLAVFLLLVLWWRSGDDRLLWPLGVCAGFCYAIKFTGGLVAPLALLAVLTRRRNLASMRIVLGAALVAGPWIVRAAILSGNPFAPLFNQYFPNAYFHIETEQKLGQYLRTYGGVHAASLPLELTLRGDALEGLLGPAWLLLPAALLALRRQHGGALLLAGACVAAPWILNIGTRFLMPALPFFALALMISIPRMLALVLLTAHAVASWPAIILLYAQPGAWALSAHNDDRHEIATFIESNTKPEDRILDLADAPVAITHRELVNTWQSASGDRLLHSLHKGMSGGPGMLVEWHSRFPQRMLSAIRIRYGSGQQTSASIQEVGIEGSNDAPLPANVLWSITAWPNIWEAPLALDRNLSTGWSTWEPVRKGMFYQVDLPTPQAISGIRIVATDAANLRLELYGREQDWSVLPLPGKPEPKAALNLRRTAMRAARREGIQFLLAVPGTDGLGLISRDIEINPSDWGLKAVAKHQNVLLYRIQ